MSKPDLKIIEHPKCNNHPNIQVIDFEWGKITIEYESVINVATSVYMLEMAKKYLME